MLHLRVLFAIQVISGVVRGLPSSLGTVVADFVASNTVSAPTAFPSTFGTVGKSFNGR